MRIRVFAPVEVARLFRTALCRVRLAIERQSGRLPSEGEAFGAMLEHARASWGLDDRRLCRWRRRQYPVFERDGWRCTVPGCTSRRSLHAHHVVFRSAGGADTLENQTTLCAFHHQRGVHGGTVRITGRAPDALRFELGTRAGHPPLARFRSDDRVI